MHGMRLFDLVMLTMVEVLEYYLNADVKIIMLEASPNRHIDWFEH